MELSAISDWSDPVLDAPQELPRVLIVGGGGTGAAILWDLVQSGFPATLVERGELTSGTTGRHHGQLHSGARYAVGDPGIAAECMEESVVLRQIAPEAIEFNHGLFVAIDDEDVEYLPDFLAGCAAAGIPTRDVEGGEARRMEPGIADSVRRAVVVPDGTIDAWRLPLHFFAAAKRDGASIRRFTEVVSVEKRDTRVVGVRVRDHVSGDDEDIGADIVVNSCGAWSGSIAEMAGVDLPVAPSPGAMVAVRERLVNMVVSRLRPPGDGDIIVPQRGLSIIGSTQTLADDPDICAPTREEIESLTASAAQMVPAFAKAARHAAWSAPRPLAAGSASPGSGRAGEETVRQLSRDFVCIDHAATDGIEGFVSVVGGKATVLRRMAEDTVDLICRKAGVERVCRTAITPLPRHRQFYLETP